MKDRARRRQGKGQRRNPGRGRRLSPQDRQEQRAGLWCSVLHVSAVGLRDNRPRLASRYEQTALSTGPGAEFQSDPVTEDPTVSPAPGHPSRSIFISPFLQPQGKMGGQAGEGLRSHS